MISRIAAVLLLSVPCVVSLALLTGCAQYQAQQQEQAAARAQAQVASDDAQCRSYGVQPGSPGYVQCRMNLDNQHAAAVQQQNAIIGAYLLRH